MNGSPMVVLAGRAPQRPLGRGLAAGARPRPDRRVGDEDGRDRDVGRVDRRRGRRRVPSPRARRTAGPTFVDIPLDAFGPGSVEIPAVDDDAFRGAAPDPDARRSGRRARRARRSGRCWSRAATSTGRHAEDALRAFAEAARVPVFVNGMGRGTLPADHELAFSRARSVALKEADLVLVAGHAARLPPRVRALRRRARRAPLRRARARSRRTPTLAASTAGDLAATFAALADAGRADRRARRLDRAPARRRAGEARGRGRSLEADDRRRSSRRGSTASCARGSTATRS